jgi:hypothetical protein
MGSTLHTLDLPLFVVARSCSWYSAADHLMTPWRLGDLTIPNISRGVFGKPAGKADKRMGQMVGRKGADDT